MKRVLLFLGSFLLGIFFFSFLVSKVGWEEIAESLRMFSFAKASGIFVLTGAFLWAGALRWRGILQSQGNHVPFSRLWKAYVGGFSLTFFMPIIPFANEVFRGSLLKGERGVPLKEGMASVVIDRILEVTSNLLVVISGGVVFLLLGDSPSYSVKSVAVIGFIAIWFALLAFLYYRIFRKKSITRIFWRNGNHVSNVEEEVFRFFRARNPFFWQGMGFSLARSAVGLVRVWMLILFLGKGIAILPGITVLAFYYLAILVPIPASLGPHDALQVVSFEAFGLGAATGAAFALIIRTIEVFFAVAGLLVVAHFGWGVLRSILIRSEARFVKLLSRRES